ncbi:MAG: hypothetical protein ABI903_00120 [Actinomycetota bacterium]
MLNDKVMSGTVALPIYDDARGGQTDDDMPDGSCGGSGAYGGFVQNAGITITDDAGTKVGLGVLPAGVRQPSDLPATRVCLFKFTVASLPSSDFYGVQIGDSPVITIPSDRIGQVSLGFNAVVDPTSGLLLLPS